MSTNRSKVLGHPRRESPLHDTADVSTLAYSPSTKHGLNALLTPLQMTPHLKQTDRIRRGTFKETGTAERNTNWPRRLNPMKETTHTAFYLGSCPSLHLALAYDSGAFRLNAIDLANSYETKALTPQISRAVRSAATEGVGWICFVMCVFQEIQLLSLLLQGFLHLNELGNPIPLLFFYTHDAHRMI